MGPMNTTDHGSELIDRGVCCFECPPGDISDERQPALTGDDRRWRSRECCSYFVPDTDAGRQDLQCQHLTNREGFTSMENLANSCDARRANESWPEVFAHMLDRIDTNSIDAKVAHQVGNPLLQNVNDDGGLGVEVSHMVCEPA